VIPLVAVLRDTSRAHSTGERHRIAIHTLAALKDERGVPPTIQRLKEPWTAGDAITALKAYGQVAVPELRKALNDPDPNIRQHARTLLPQVGGGTRESVELEQAYLDLKSGDPGRRNGAVDVLARTKFDPERQPEVAATLEQVVRDPQAGRHRGVAAKALEVWGTKDNAPALIDLLKEENNRDGRREAIQTLAKLKDERAAEAIAAILPSAFERGDAAKALKDIGPAAEKAVFPYLSHQEKIVRLEAVRILQAIGTRLSVIPLQQALGAAQQARENDLVAFINLALRDIGKRQ
jgi:HEAT repeat protein